MLLKRLQLRKGGKAKSKVNAAGKWSARKAQALAKAYKKAGGGYK